MAQGARAEIWGCTGEVHPSPTHGASVGGGVMRSSQ